MSTLVSSLVCQPLVLRKEGLLLHSFSTWRDPHEYSKQAGETSKITLGAEHDCPSRIHSRDIQRDSSVNVISRLLRFRSSIGNECGLQ
jgi:hypothetical protein